MEKKNIAIIAAVIIVIVAIGAVLAVMGTGEKKVDDPSIGGIGTFVPIYGNATGDLYIDQNDIDVLEAMIKGDIQYDESKHPYADSNQDGVIDSKDVELVRNIIDVKPCEVLYQDYFGEVTAVNFPLKDRKIAVTYYQQAEACAILGVLDDVVVASKAATVYGTMWPTLDDAVEWGTTGSSAITDDAVEKFINNDVDLVICTPRIENQELAKRLHNERNIDFIQLWYNGDYCISTIQTMAILMDAQDKSKAYMDYCNGVMEDMSSKITDNTSKSILVINGYNAETDQITIMANERHGSYTLINKYLGKCYYEEGTNQFGFVYHNVEWLVNHSQDFDCIVFCMSGSSGYSDDQKTGTYYLQDDYNAKFEGVVKYFERTKAYQNGNIVGSVYPNIFGFSAYAVLEVIAAQVYPDSFDLDKSFDTLQEWFDKYNKVDIDVRTQGPITYTGTGYDASYPQL